MGPALRLKFEQLLPHMIQRTRTTPRHPTPQLGERETEFTGGSGVVDLPPLMMSPVHSRLDGRRTRRLPHRQPRDRHREPGPATTHRIPGQHREISPHFDPVQRFFGTPPVRPYGGLLVLGGKGIGIEMTPGLRGGGDGDVRVVVGVWRGAVGVWRGIVVACGGVVGV